MRIERLVRTSAALLIVCLGCATTTEPLRGPAAELCVPSGPPRCESGDCIDLMFVIDRSMSTRSTWHDDTSVLEGETRAAKQLLRTLGDASLRAGIAGFSGDRIDPFTEDLLAPPDPSWTEVGLTDDHACVADHLDWIATRDPRGTTHTASGIDQATRELAGLSESVSHRDRTRRRVIVLITDGIPTLPPGPGFPRENFRSVQRALARAFRADVRVFAIAIGEEAAELGFLEEEFALTGGGLHVVVTTDELDAAVGAIALAIEGS